MAAYNLKNVSSVHCGLFREISNETERVPPTKCPIPLISVDVNASLVHAVAQVEVTQVYVNKEEQPIEAIYFFPVNPEGAVTHFQAELEGRVIKGVVKAHEEAKEEYERAVRSQRTAFLGEETKADIFKIRVGFLKPGSQVKVIIGYVTQVKNEPGTNAIRFYIPTTVAPRYVSPSEKDDKAKEIGNMRFSDSSPARLTLKVVVSLQDKIKSIESPTHSIQVEKQGQIPGKQGWEKALVKLSGTTIDMDRDFVLNILPEQIHKPRLYSEKMADGSTAVMVHLIPSFKLDEQKTELIFVLDRSGSMNGQSIRLAKEALLLFLHSMPADCYFNVIGFGSSFSFLFPNSAKYDDGTLKIAVAHTKDLEADLGGTEILKPLKDIFEKPEIKGYLRQVFVLTDGQVSNTDGVIGLTQANAHKARVFALGIGNGASHHLVEGLAKAGGGTAAFVAYNESINNKVLNQLKNALQPSLTDIKLTWEGVELGLPTENRRIAVNKEKTLMGYNKPIEPVPESRIEYKQSPKQIPPIHDGSQLLVFGLFHRECPSGVVITALSPDGPLTIRLEHSDENDVGTSGMLHRLAALKLVRELELEISGLSYQGVDQVSQSEESKKNEIIEIACKNGITSKYTSFVAIDVEDETKQLLKNWGMETRYVPLQLAHRWYGGKCSLNSLSCASTTSALTKPYSFLLPLSLHQGDTANVPSQLVHFSHGGKPPHIPRRCASIEPLYAPLAPPFPTILTNFNAGEAHHLRSTPNAGNDLMFRSSPNVVPMPIDSLQGNNDTMISSTEADDDSGEDIGFGLFDDYDETKNETLDEDLEEESVLFRTSCQKLINLQCYDGSFALDDKLSDIIAIPLDKLNEGKLI
ncbi:unnamed protein product [Orchesella dallaii]|uniref:von Willebrand factor A domain-containing protein 5A n=1 Tax=Orchesella dallaii TaxID=48710 RepID=A0ABP1QMH1_9HEXA